MATPQLLDLNGTYTTDSLGQIFLNVPALDVMTFEKVHFEILQWPQQAGLKMTVRCAIGKTRPPGDTLAQWVAEFPLAELPPKIRSFDVVGPDFWVVLEGGPPNLTVPIQAWIFLH